ncbi:fimbria/pilus outer membrane usher protein [Acinetobacter soli]|uniref:fimbria/pilus outer membrane usher protein n=1 Tax=Acinetobacter soli TaxID=487316 RepID=UPI001D18773E|nr:fimbria/pilus outer membrane usher protein [Acinetobacter soli]
MMKHTSAIAAHTVLSVAIHSLLFHSNQLYANTPVSELSSSQELYTFDAKLLKGTGLNQELIDRFNQSSVLQAGSYTVDLYVNQHLIGRREIRFIDDPDQPGKVDACWTDALLDQANIVGDLQFQKSRTRGQNTSSKEDCLKLAQIAPGSQIDFDYANLRLDLNIAQQYLRSVPRGYVNPEELDAGQSIGFLNYSANYYRTENRFESKQNYESGFLSLNAGANIGKWQYRQQSNFSIDNDHHTQWNHIRSYLQRPINSLTSVLTLGQQYGSGQFFSTLPYLGLSLQTDERMRPDSMRGYAPVIRGTAQTNAKVSIQQNGREIYQINVAPGPFEIKDLYPTNFEGNLKAVVTEADGSVHVHDIPYAAVPNSLRAGLYNYNFSVGKTDLDHAQQAYFSDFNYEYGLNNSITVNGGFRLSQDYQALLFGGVWGSTLGALGTNITYSRADITTSSGKDTTDGWMANINYSKTIQPTNTTIAIAGYRYSTEGYRELGDILGLAYATKQGGDWVSNTYLQRSRFQINLSQQFGQLGSFYLAGSTQNYRDERKRDTSFQAGFSKSIGIMSFNLNYTRQKTYAVRGDRVKEEYSDNFGGISIHIPLGKARNPLRPTLSAYYNQSKNNENYQLAMNGALDPDYSLNYTIGVNGASDHSDTTYSAGLYKRFASLQVGVNSAYSHQYWQNSISANGAVALHSGGVTLGPYLTDTFGLVEAKGAQGAKVISSPYSKIDRFGYALIPSLSPYRYNSIILDPQGIANNIELIGGEQRVAPYAGASVKIKFLTRTGYNVLIQSHLNNQQVIPMGTDVFNAEEEVIGMVGQGGQMYLRVAQPEGTLRLRWSDQQGTSSCSLPYTISDVDLSQPLIKLSAVCNMENK